MNLKFQKVFTSWNTFFNNIIDTPYFETLMEYLSKEYKIYKVFPDKKQVFRTFRETPYEKLRVVIIGDPEIDELYEGIPFGCTENTLVYQSYTETIERCLEDNCGFRFNYDITCKSWCNQGVLMLGTRLTNKGMFKGAHREPWRSFTRYVVDNINKNKQGIIFCLWGNEANEYEDLINKNRNIILKCEHPKVAANENRSWQCDHFKEINKIIERQNGEEFKIKW